MNLFRSLSLLALASCAVASQADLFHLTYDVAGRLGTVSADLFLTADAIAGSPGQFHVTGVSGRRGSETVAGFLAGGPAPFFEGGVLSDNVLYYPSGPVVDAFGINYSTRSGAYSLYSKVGYGEFFTDGRDTLVFAVSNVSLSPVASPAVPGPMAALPFALIALRRRKRA